MIKEKVLVSERIGLLAALSCYGVLLFYMLIRNDVFNIGEPFCLTVMFFFMTFLLFAFTSRRIVLYEDGIGYASWFGHVFYKTPTKVVHFSEIEHVSSKLGVEVKEDKIVFFRGRRLVIYTHEAEFLFPDPSDYKEIDVLAFLEENIQPTRPEVFLDTFDCTFFPTREIETLTEMVTFNFEPSHAFKKLLLGYLTETEPALSLFDENKYLKEILEWRFKCSLEHLKTLPIEYDE